MGDDNQIYEDGAVTYLAYELPPPDPNKLSFTDKVEKRRELLRRIEAERRAVLERIERRERQAILGFSVAVIANIIALIALIAFILEGLNG